MRGELQERLQLLTLLSDVLSLHQRFISTGDPLTLHNYHAALNNPSISKSVALKMPMFMQLDFTALQLEVHLADHDYSLIHRQLHLSTLRSSMPQDHADQFQLCMYTRLLQKVLQPVSTSRVPTSSVRDSLLQLFGPFDTPTATRLAEMQGSQDDIFDQLVGQLEVTDGPDEPPAETALSPGLKEDVVAVLAISHSHLYSSDFLETAVQKAHASAPGSILRVMAIHGTAFVSEAEVMLQKQQVLRGMECDFQVYQAILNNACASTTHLLSSFNNSADVEGLAKQARQLFAGFNTLQGKIDSIQDSLAHITKEHTVMPHWAGTVDSCLSRLHSLLYDLLMVFITTSCHAIDSKVEASYSGDEDNNDSLRESLVVLQGITTNLHTLHGESSTPELHKWTEGVLAVLLVGWKVCGSSCSVADHSQWRDAQKCAAPLLAGPGDSFLKLVPSCASATSTLESTMKTVDAKATSNVRIHLDSAVKDFADLLVMKSTHLRFVPGGDVDINQLAVTEDLSVLSHQRLLSQHYAIGLFTAHQAFPFITCLQRLHDWQVVTTQVVIDFLARNQTSDAVLLCDPDISARILSLISARSACQSFFTPDFVQQLETPLSELPQHTIDVMQPMLDAATAIFEEGVKSNSNILSALSEQASKTFRVHVERLRTSLPQMDYMFLPAGERDDERILSDILNNPTAATSITRTCLNVPHCVGSSRGVPTRQSLKS